MRTHSALACLALAVASLGACSDSAPIVDRGPATIPLEVPNEASPAATPDVAPTEPATATPRVVAEDAAEDGVENQDENQAGDIDGSPELTPLATATPIPAGPGRIREDPNSKVGEYGAYNCTDASQLRYTLSLISWTIAEAANRFPARVWQCEDTPATNQVLECYPERTEQLLDVLEARSSQELVDQLRANNIVFCKASTTGPLAGQ